MNVDDDIKYAIHGLNRQAHNLNKNIVQKASGMQDVGMSKDIYEKKKNPAPNPQPIPSHQPPPQQPQPQLQQKLQPQIPGDPALLNKLIERVSSVESQITKFVNLIERRVAKNAKEINIRIKLNENNDSTNKE